MNLIYEGVHRSPIDSETAFRLMGFTGKTGTSAKALGSLRQYGLIEGIGDNTRVSDLALAILEPESDVERALSIHRASRSPDVFESVFARFNDRLPQADEPIRAFLIRELGFQKNSADECIKTLRESIAFANSYVPPQPDPIDDSDNDESEPETGRETGDQQANASVQETRATLENPTQSAAIPLTRDCRAELNIYGNLTEKAVKNLIRAIELLSDVWTEEDG